MFVRREPNPLYAKYASLGGWMLLFFVLQALGVAFGALGVVVLAVMTIGLLPLGAPIVAVAAVLVLLLMGGVSVAFSGVIIWMLATKRPSFLTLLCISLVLDVVAIIASSAFSGFQPSADFDLSSYLMGLARSTLWIVYFTKSVRVRTYMGSDDYITRCPFTSWMTPPEPVEPYLTVFDGAWPPGQAGPPPGPPAPPGPPSGSQWQAGPPTPPGPPQEPPA
jgi:hypothetical protein